MDGADRKVGRTFWDNAGSWIRSSLARKNSGRGIGLALGGGFARGIAHVGVLRALERNHVPIAAVSGVSSGAIVAAAIASGATSDEIESVALSMKFRDVARWTLNLTGLAQSDRMITFLTRLLKANRFEDMQKPLAIVATDLVRARPVTFHGKGDVVLPIRASCSYPGLFLPIRHEGMILVDGFVAMEVPAEPLLQLGVKHVISVAIPNQEGVEDYGNMLSVINRSFQIMSAQTENTWRRYSDLVLTPAVANVAWDSFATAKRMIALGEEAAEAAMPTIQRWLAQAETSSQLAPAPGAMIKSPSVPMSTQSAS